MPSSLKEEFFNALSSPVILFGIIALIVLFIIIRKKWGNTVKADIVFMRSAAAIAVLSLALASGIPLGFYHARDLQLQNRITGFEWPMIFSEGTTPK